MPSQVRHIGVRLKGFAFQPEVALVEHRGNIANHATTYLKSNGVEHHLRQLLIRLYDRFESLGHCASQWQRRNALDDPISRWNCFCDLLDIKQGIDEPTLLSGHVSPLAYQTLRQLTQSLHLPIRVDQLSLGDLTTFEHVELQLDLLLASQSAFVVIGEL